MNWVKGLFGRTGTGQSNGGSEQAHELLEQKLFGGQSPTTTHADDAPLPEAATLPDGKVVSIEPVIQQLVSEDSKRFDEGIELAIAMTGAGIKAGRSVLREAIKRKSRARAVIFYEPIAYPVEKNTNFADAEFVASSEALGQVIAARGKVAPAVLRNNRYISTISELLSLAAKKNLLADVRHSGQLLASLPFMAAQNKGLALKCMIQASDVMAGGGNTQGFAFTLLHTELKCSFLLAHPDKPEDPSLRLRAAVTDGKIELVNQLLREGADPNGADESGLTPLLLAATAGNLAAASALCESGATPEAPEPKGGLTALHLAAFGGHSAVVSFLLNAKVNVNTVSSDGRTPLHFATAKGHADVVALLLANGADPEARQAEGGTPLQWAASSGNAAAVSVLVTAGAVLDAQDNSGMTALHAAALRGHTEVVALLVHAGADMTVTDCFGGTPLHAAAGAGHLEAIRTLVEAGANPLAKADGRTPLDIARANGRTSVVHFLETSSARSR